MYTYLYGQSDCRCRCYLRSHLCAHNACGGEYSLSISYMSYVHVRIYVRTCTYIRTYMYVYIRTYMYTLLVINMLPLHSYQSCDSHVTFSSPGPLQLGQGLTTQATTQQPQQLGLGQGFKLGAPQQVRRTCTSIIPRLH